MRSVTYRIARRIAVALVGGSVLLVGIAMIVLPGPAIVVIPMGLGILGIEFAWARVWLKKIKAAGSKVVNTVQSKRSNADQRNNQDTHPPDNPHS
jgi:tellurite resistance protein TerC